MFIRTLKQFKAVSIKYLTCRYVTIILLIAVSCMNFSAQNTEIFVDSQVVSDSAFSPTAFTLARVARTREAISNQASHSIPTKQVCEHSSGDVMFMTPRDFKSICWYANDYRRIFQRAAGVLRTQDFLLCDRDCAASPLDVFTLAKSRSIEADVNRTVTVLPLNVGRHFKFVPRAFRDSIPFILKNPVAVWRGVSTSACWHLPLNASGDDTDYRKECSRRDLVTRWSLDKSVDVGLTELVQLDDFLKARYTPYLKKEIPFRELLKYRYIISVEGNDVATNLKWALASNSVVLMPTPTKESIILEGSLLPWVHFVPLREDTADLYEKVMFCEKNLSFCRKISLEATEYMKTYSSRAKLFHLGAHILQRHVDLLKCFNTSSSYTLC